MAHVTLRTIRYYDKQNILKPSYVTEAGARFYTDEDFARLQQILLLKYLGFSLDDIRDMTIDDADYHFMLNSLNIQLKLVRDRIEQMQLVEQAIQDTSDLIQKEHSIDWSQMLNLIHLTGMEKSMKNQYQDASNISARINLHSLYSQNTKGWFPWIFEQLELKPGMKVLELGCGDGTLWNVDRDKIPEQTEIVVSDISDGMLRDARRTIGADDSRFRFRVFDAGRIPYDEDSFDLVIANHVLFYCEDIPKVCKEVKRVLKPGGRFVCSTYGNDHMREVSELVQKFDDRIVLAAKNLYERFGKENGEEILQKDFEKIEWRRYEDSLIVPEPEPLISYILSCHGNQGQYILDRYKEFQSYVRKKTEGGFHITKDGEDRQVAELKKFFNVNGSCNPQIHYMIDLSERLSEIKKMVDAGEYFTINRARQYGKTTLLAALAEYLKSDYKVISLDFQTISYGDFENEEKFVAAFSNEILISEYDIPEDIRSTLLHLADGKERNVTLSVLFRTLLQWCRISEKPLVLIIDEVDTATNNQVFVDFLAQLRAYYLRRMQMPTFRSVILAGVYDVRNVKSKIRPEENHKTNSPWNIAAKFKIDMNFSVDDISGMLNEYEQDYQTGMDVVEIAEMIYSYTSGYPYLVSCLCKMIDEDIKGESKTAWSKQDVLTAVKMLLNDKNPLFESLIGKLNEYQGVKNLIYRLLFRGENIGYNPDDSGIDMAEMFGFIKVRNGNVYIANRIFETRLYNMFLMSTDE